MDPTASILDWVDELRGYSHELSVLDRTWNILFPGKGRHWHHLHVNQYKHTFYITLVDGGGGGLEVEPRRGVRVVDRPRCTGPTRISTGTKTCTTSCTTMIWAGSNAGSPPSSRGKRCPS